MHRSRVALLAGVLFTLAFLGPSAPTGALAAADTVPPLVGSPTVRAARGDTVRRAAIPLRVAWTASDPGGSGVAATSLQVSIDGGSWERVALRSARSSRAVVAVRPPHDARFRVRATDRAGNTSPWAYSPATRWTLASEAATGVTTTGSWSTVTGTAYLGDRALRARQAGAALSFAFHGRSVAWFGRESSAGGSAQVLVDGQVRATIDTRSGSTSDHRVLYTTSWADAGDHVLTIRVLGTAGHPDVVVDGFVVGRPPPDDPVLVGAGDISYCDHPGDNRTARLLDAIPGRVFVAGDTAYPDGSAGRFRECYDPTWGRWRLRTSPAIGNHEYHTDDGGPYWDYFGSRAGQRGRGWYAYDLGTWRVYTLNSNCTEVGCAAGSAQERWLRADLASNPRACVAAVMHHPLFSSGVHGDNPAVRPLWQALADHDADVVLTGHDHSYERFAPQTPAGAAAQDGLRLFVVGTGGAPMRGFPTRHQNSEVRHTGTWGVLELTLRDGSYGWRFVPVAGGTFSDAGTAACH